jgi:MscS family membrane protein
LTLWGWTIHPAFLHALGWLVAGLGVAVLFPVVIGALTRRSASDLDDLLTARIRWPIASAFTSVGVWTASNELSLPDPYPWVVRGVLFTVVVTIWTVALTGTSRDFLDWLVRHRERYSSIVTDRSLPAFDIGLKSFLWGGGAYFVFLAWEIDLTGWLASAGVIGVAVGFAAKDTLANLVAGVFVLAEAPYKLGDYLIVDGVERGAVIEIGMRTTRLRTRDDVEIIVPNALMANSKIVNQSGGPLRGSRVRVAVGVAYGSDVDQIKARLIAAAAADPLVMKQPEPRVRLRAFGDSALQFELLVWVADAGTRGIVTDQLLCSIYKDFGALGIEIPFPQRVVHTRASGPATGEG